MMALLAQSLNLAIGRWQDEDVPHVSPSERTDHNSVHQWFSEWELAAFDASSAFYLRMRTQSVSKILCTLQNTIWWTMSTNNIVPSQCTWRVCNLAAHSMQVHWANNIHKHMIQQTTLHEWAWNNTAYVNGSYYVVIHVPRHTTRLFS